MKEVSIDNVLGMIPAASEQELARIERAINERRNVLSQGTIEYFWNNMALPSLNYREPGTNEIRRR